MNIFKKIWLKIRLFWYGLFYGFKAVDDSMASTGVSLGDGMTINKHQETNSLAKDLLRGEVTQQVEELRYRTYLVDRESKDFDYYSPTLALRKETRYAKQLQYENIDNLEIITIQPNNCYGENLLETLDHVNDNDNIEVVKINGKEEISCNVGKIDKNKKYSIQIGREKDITPRYYIDKFISRVAVFKTDNENVMRLDIYIPDYYNPSNFIKKNLLKDLELIMSGYPNSDTARINHLEFITDKAYQIDDLVKFVFHNLKFISITKYDGNYILHYDADLLSKEQDDLVKRFYNKEMAQKYEEKAPRQRELTLGDPVIKVMTCEHCGKQAVYDPMAMAEAYATDENGLTFDVESETKDEMTEYFDMQIAEQTYGKCLCRKCLQEYLKTNPTPIQH